MHQRTASLLRELRKPANRAAFEYTRLLTTHWSKSFALSARMLPREQRWATYALYGLCRYADNLVDTPRRRARGELLQEIDALRHELQIAYRTGESEHPVLRAFIIVAQHCQIPIELPEALLKGIQMDLEKTRYATFDDLYDFCYHVAGVVGLMMTHVLGYRDTTALGYAEKLGIAMQLTNILRDIQEDKNMGRIYLPLDELGQFGVCEEDILDDKMTPEMRRLMEFQVARADRYYTDAHPGIRLLHPRCQFAIYAASRIYRGILRGIEGQHYNPFLGRVVVSPIRKRLILSHELLRTQRMRLGKPWQH